MFKSFQLLLFTLIASIPFNASAIIIDHGNITEDTSSNLLWLDLTETLASGRQTEQRLLAGGDLEGWRYATSNELSTLLANWGLVNTPPTGTLKGAEYWAHDAINDELIDTVIHTLGDTYTEWVHNYGFGSGYVTTDEPDQSWGTYGFLADTFQPNDRYFASIFNGAGDLFIDDWETVNFDNSVKLHEDNDGGSYGSIYVGHFLVRDSSTYAWSIPEPSAVTLLSFGLISLLLATTRKERT